VFHAPILHADINMQIPIVFITDNNYALPTGVAITSLIINKKPETIYKIHVIVTNDVTEENKEKLLTNGKENVSIDLIEIDISFLEKYRKPTHPVPPCGLLKFKIPGLFPQYDKMIYLDGDILVKDDLTEFFNIDISNFYLGAVSDFPALKWIHSNKRMYQKDYFNSGVLLLNTKLMINNNFEERAFQIKDENYDLKYFMDQDVFNLITEENVFYFHIKYNAMINIYKSFFSDIIAEFNLHYNTLYDSYDDLYHDTVIVHLPSIKPWIYKNVFYHNEWMQYFKQSPFKDLKLKLKSYNKR